MTDCNGMFPHCPNNCSSSLLMQRSVLQISVFDMNTVNEDLDSAILLALLKGMQTL